MKLKTTGFLICQAAAFAAATVVFAGNTSTEQPDGIEDLTTSDATKAFSIVKPTSTDWLAFNDSNNQFLYSLDYTHAFDNGGKYDRSDRSILEAMAADFGYSFDTPVTVNGYKIYLPADSTVNPTDRAPSTWTFEGSDDRENWDTLDSRSGEDGWTVAGARYYAFENAKAYRHYRLNVTETANSDAKYLQISELEFFNTNPNCADPQDFASHQSFKIAGLDAGVEEARLPVLVRVATSKLAGVRDDHKDICFTQGEDNECLPYEVESWDSKGDACIWVCVKSAVRGAEFTMHWGADEDYATPNRYKWTGYASVVHFNDSETPVVSSVDGTTGACVGSKWTGEGLVSGGVDGPKTRILKPFATLKDQSKFTVSVWTKPSKNDVTMRIVSTKGAYGNDGMELIYVKDAGIYVRGNKSDKTLVCKASNGTAFPVGSWVHYAAVLEDETAAVYRNGEPMSGEGTINKSTLSSSDAMLGGYNGDDNSSNLSGVMDEFRLYNGVQSAQRVKAEYQAMNPTTFLTTDVIPSVVTVTSVTSAEDEARLTIAGLVSFGEGVESETVVIGVGAENGVWTSTYEIPMQESGVFEKAITDLSDGRYYFAVGLKGKDGSWTEGRLVRIGTIDPISWTGAGDGSSWTDPANWSGSVVPVEIDTALFGEGVAADLTVSVDASVRAQKILVTTSHAVRLGAAADPGITAMDVKTETGAGRFIYVANLSLSEGCVIDAAEGTEVSVSQMPSSGNLVKRGAGKLTFLVEDGKRTGGTTTVEAGRLEFGGAKNLLGATLIVGGFGEDAVAYSTFDNAWNYSPFSSQTAVIEIRDRGLFDLSRTQQSPTFQTFSKIAVAKGGVLNLGHTKINVAGGGDGYILEGTVLGESVSDLMMQGGRLIVPATIAEPVVLSGGYRMRVATLDVADNPDIPVELTIKGRLESNNWPLSDKDGIIKDGQGVLRLGSVASTFGGNSSSEGTTVINAGTLLADNKSGSATGKSFVWVKAGGTLGGCGTVGGLADSPNAKISAGGSGAASAVIRPGTIDDETGLHVPATLTVGSSEQPSKVLFNDYSELKIGVGEKRVADSLAVFGPVTIGTNTKLTIGPENVAVDDVRGGTFTILSASDGITGDFAEVVVPKKTWKVNKVVEDGVIKALTVTVPGRGLMVIIK